MFQPETLFQRSHSGRSEIYKKACGLTQSERLVLIMVDGVTPYLGLRSKMAGLTEDRIQRALHTLLEKELVHEVLLPVPDQLPEEIDKQVVDRYLLQDPLDPVTVISLDPEEDLAAIPRRPTSPSSAVLPVEGSAQAGRRASAPQLDAWLKAQLQTYVAASSELDQSDNGSVTREGPITVSATSPLSGDTMAAGSAQLVWGVPEQFVRVDNSPAIFESGPRSMLESIRRLHWGYWAIGAGCALLGFSLVGAIVG